MGEGAAPIVANSLLDMAAGVEGVGRHFTYTNGIAPHASVYNLFPGLAFGARARMFPGRPLGHPWSDIGVDIGGALTLLQHGQSQGALLSTIPISYVAALCARIHPWSSERFLLRPSVGYAFTDFGAVGPANAELPDVSYRSLRTAVDALMVFDRVSIDAEVAFRAVVDEGAISSRFYDPQGFGLDSELGVAWMFLRRLEARLAARYELYSFSFKPQAGATFGAGKALDQMFGLRASGAVLF